MKIVFVILHYLAIDETYKSVDSIEKKIDTDMYKIVIVDNASPDKSGALLKEHYKNDDHVEVLLNQENLGFAREIMWASDMLKKHGIHHILC